MSLVEFMEVWVWQMYFIYDYLFYIVFVDSREDVVLKQVIERDLLKSAWLYSPPRSLYAP